MLPDDQKPGQKHCDSVNEYCGDSPFSESLCLKAEYLKGEQSKEASEIIIDRQRFCHLSGHNVSPTELVDHRTQSASFWTM